MLKLNSSIFPVIRRNLVKYPVSSFPPASKLTSRASATTSLSALRTRARTFHTRSATTPLLQAAGASKDLASKERSHLSRKPIGPDGVVEANAKTGAKDINNIEYFAPISIGLFLVTGGLLYYFFQREKKKQDEKRAREDRQSYGTPQIGGGEFSLLDQDGNPFTDKDLLGHFSLIYFGFSHCPDICPDELDKLGCWLDALEKCKMRDDILPIFITCDPNRDGPEVLKEYLSDFHPGIVGLTGTYAEIKKVCKQYRVYFSTPENVQPGQDYLVDHSIFFYLMDPEGKFITVLGRNLDEVTGVEKIKEALREYKRSHK